MGAAGGVFTRVIQNKFDRAASLAFEINQAFVWYDRTSFWSLLFLFARPAAST